MRPNNRKNQIKAAALPQDSSDSEGSFETPNNENETDYGLDFTSNSLLEPHTSGISSTLQRTHIEDESAAATHSQDENQISAPAVRTRSSNQRPVTSNTRPTRGNAPPPSRRKRRQPEHLAKRMNREIALLQTSIKFLIPRLPFSRVVRELLQETSNVGILSITRDALEAIQTSAEMYLTQRFEDAYLLTRYRNRVTLEIRDMALVAYFCKTYGKS